LLVSYLLRVAYLWSRRSISRSSLIDIVSKPGQSLLARGSYQHHARHISHRGEA
jgi:hypothetical protein